MLFLLLVQKVNQTIHQEVTTFVSQNRQEGQQLRPIKEILKKLRQEGKMNKRQKINVVTISFMFLHDGLLHMLIIQGKA